MTARVLTGSKQEIARKVADLAGEVREAIVFVDETTDLPRSAGESGGAGAQDIFVEMEPVAVHVGNVDDSRAALYTRLEGE